MPLGGYRIETHTRQSVPYLEGIAALKRKQGVPKSYSDEALLAEIKRVAGFIHGWELRKIDFDEHCGIASAKICCQRFGNWRLALEKAGVVHLYSMCPTGRSVEEMLAELRRVAGLVEESTLTMVLFKEHSDIPPVSIGARFGGWHFALERAGLGHRYSGLPAGPRRRYSTEDLTSEISRVAELVKRPVLTQTDLMKHSEVHLSTLTRRFGNWPLALKAAGVGHMLPGLDTRRLYSDERLLNEVRQVAKLIEKPVLSMPDFGRYSKVSPGTIKQRFGTWHAALERAGIGHMYIHAHENRNKRPSEKNPPAREDKFSKENLLAEVRRVAGLVESPALTVIEFKKHSAIGLNTLRRRFGSWREILDRGGAGHMFRWSAEASARIAQAKHPDDELLGELRRVAKLIEKPVLLMPDFRRYSKVSPGTIRQRFGTWHAALERAGIPEMPPRSFANRVKYSNEEMLAELRRVAELVGKPALIQLDFNEHSVMCGRAVLRRFGGWRKALESAGLGHLYFRATDVHKDTATRYSDETLLEELRRVAKLVGEPVLTYADFDRHSKISSVTVSRRLGGWFSALERAGLAHMCSKGTATE